MTHFRAITSHADYVWQSFGSGLVELLDQHLREYSLSEYLGQE